MQEAAVDVHPEMRGHFFDLHRILVALKDGNIAPALE